MEEFTLTEQEINQCLKAYEDLDDDGNGLVSIYDFQTALQKVNIVLSEIELAKLISELDCENTGFIKFADFLELVRKRRFLQKFGENDQDTLDAYVAIGGPKDKSGHINAKILVRIIKEEFELPINIQKLIEQIDDSGNGEIQYNEFQNLLKKKYANPIM